MSSPRRRRRAVGPPGAPVGEEPRVEREPEEPEAARDDDDRLRLDRPPHHDRGV